jgi:hypothetical protein
MSLKVDYWLFQEMERHIDPIEDYHEMSGIIFHLERLLAYCNLHQRSIIVKRFEKVEGEK